MFNGHLDAHDDAGGQWAMLFEEGAGPMLPMKGCLPIRVGQTAVASNDERGGLDYGRACHSFGLWGPGARGRACRGGTDMSALQVEDPGQASMFN